jgi:hypothetical protein
LSKQTFASIGYELRQIVNQTEPDLARISDADACKRLNPTKWSKKEILAHLIDSATNNHQRFVRGVEGQGGIFAGYNQDFLVKLQRSNEAEWPLIIALWTTYNRYLAHILSSLPPEAAEYSVTVASNPPATLLFIASDYVEHLKHHLNQIVGRRYTSTYQPG